MIFKVIGTLALVMMVLMIISCFYVISGNKALIERRRQLDNHMIKMINTLMDLTESLNFYIVEVNNLREELPCKRCLKLHNLTTKVEIVIVSESDK